MLLYCRFSCVDESEVELADVWWRVMILTFVLAHLGPLDKEGAFSLSFIAHNLNVKFIIFVLLISSNKITSLYKNEFVRSLSLSSSVSYYSKWPNSIELPKEIELRNKRFDTNTTSRNRKIRVHQIQTF